MNIRFCIILDGYIQHLLLLTTMTKSILSLVIYIDSNERMLAYFLIEQTLLRRPSSGSVHIWAARQTLETSIFVTKPATAWHIGRALAPNQRHSAAPREKTSVCSHKEWVQICTKTIVYVAISPAPSPLPPRAPLLPPRFIYNKTSDLTWM